MTTSGQRDTYDDEQDGTALGIAYFAGILLITLGGFQILQGLSAVLKDDVFVKGVDYVYAIDLTTWGWVTLLLGALALAIGVGILKGQVWALSAGIGYAVLSALAQFTFMPYYPLWALLVIFMDILVIWALARQISRA